MYVFIEYTVQYHNQSKEFEKSLKYLNMGFTGMFSVETVLKIIGFGVKVGIIIQTGSTEPTHSFQNQLSPQPTDWKKIFYSYFQSVFFSSFVIPNNFIQNVVIFIMETKEPYILIISSEVFNLGQILRFFITYTENIWRNWFCRMHAYRYIILSKPFLECILVDRMW